MECSIVRKAGCAMETAVERWQALLDARARQMDSAYARLGRTSADFWDRRARGYHRSTKQTALTDPFFRRVSSEVKPQMSVLDVGAGTGRFARSEEHTSELQS